MLASSTQRESVMQLSAFMSYCHIKLSLILHVAQWVALSPIYSNVQLQLNLAFPKTLIRRPSLLAGEGLRVPL